MPEDFLAKKTELVLGGDISIPEGHDDPLFEYRDGEPHSVVLMFGDCRVRKRISPDGEFLLKPTDDGYLVERNGEVFLDYVELKRMVCHSPDLAVVTIGKEDGVLSPKEVMQIISDYETQMIIRGITLHSGRGCSKEHYLEVMRSLRWWYPDLPIGIGINGFTREDMAAFREGGATNAKITLPSLVRRIMDAVEPGSDLDSFMQVLSDAVSIFGRGNVVCTTYIGLGETEDEYDEAIGRICSAGVMPDVKVKKSRDKVRAAVAERFGEPERITPAVFESRLRKLKSVMEENGLEPYGFKTLCYGCRLCSIVPFVEF